MATIPRNRSALALIAFFYSSWFSCKSSASYSCKAGGRRPPFGFSSTNLGRAAKVRPYHCWAARLLIALFLAAQLSSSLTSSTQFWWQLLKPTQLNVHTRIWAGPPLAGLTWCRKRRRTSNRRDLRAYQLAEIVSKIFRFSLLTSALGMEVFRVASIREI